MSQSKKLFLCLSTFLFSAAFADTWITLNSGRLEYAVEGLNKLAVAGAPSCFKVNQDKQTLHLFAKKCVDVTEADASQQNWKLSAPISTKILDYVKPVEEKFGADAGFAETFKKIKAAAPNDSAGQFIFMNFKDRPVVVGFLKLNVAGDETNDQASPYIAELCTGAWKMYCSYKFPDDHPEQGAFDWVFRFAPTFDDAPINYKIVDILHSAVFARGNDDFQAFTYFTMKGTGATKDQSFPISPDWYQALKPFDKDGRLSKESQRLSFPRSEANYMTAFHPVSVFVIEDEQGAQKTVVYFGAEVYYPKVPSEQSCESDNGSFKLYDLDEINPPKPVSPDAISKLDLKPFHQNAMLQEMADYFSLGDAADNAYFHRKNSSLYPMFLVSIGGAIEINPQTKKSWSYVILKPDDYGATDIRSNPVREFLYVDRKDSGEWASELYAYNPNEWEANNELLESRQLLYSPGSILPVWTSDKPTELLPAQPMLREPMFALNKIPLEAAGKSDAGKKELTIGLALRDQFKKFRFSGSDMNTIHEIPGLREGYSRMLTDMFQRAPYDQVTAANLIPTYLSVTTYDRVSKSEVHTTAPADAVTLKLYTNLAARNLQNLVGAAVSRVYTAETPAAQMLAEQKYQTALSDQALAVQDYFSARQSLKDAVKKLNDNLKQKLWPVLRTLPHTYVHVDYDDQGNGHETTKPLPKEVDDAIFKQQIFRAIPTLAKLDQMILTVNNTRLTADQRLKAANDFYALLFTKRDELQNDISIVIYDYMSHLGIRPVQDAPVIR